VRILTVGVLGGLVAAVALAGCGKKCSPSSCADGCCDNNDTCQPPALSACGLNGAACAACLVGQICQDGACDYPGGGTTGSTTSTSNGSGSTGSSTTHASATASSSAGSSGAASTNTGASTGSVSSSGGGSTVCTCAALGCENSGLVCDLAACTCVQPSSTSTSSSGTTNVSTSTTTTSSSGSMATTGSSGTSGSGGTCAQVTQEASYSFCNATSPSTDFDLSSLGCTPNVDGTIYAEEWADASQCFLIDGSLGAITVFMKYGADSLYLFVWNSLAATDSVKVYVEKDGDGVMNGTYTSPDEYYGDLSDSSCNASQPGYYEVWNQGSYATASSLGWTAACAGTSSPWHYEIRIPFAEAGITPGAAHTLRLAVQHGTSDVYPYTAMVSSNGTLDDSSKWVTVHSSSNWQ
jgi:hypothetical protein